MKWVRQQPCIITGRTGEDIDPAHIRHGLGGGMGLKPSDDLVLPVVHAMHAKQHSLGEETFWFRAVVEDRDLLMRAIKALAREQYREWKS